MKEIICYDINQNTISTRSNKIFSFFKFFRKAFARKKVFSDTKVTLEHEIRKILRTPWVN